MNPTIFMRNAIRLSLATVLMLCPKAGFSMIDRSGLLPDGALAVASDPPGAAVYVDGQFAGQTPVNVNRLSTGDHRLRVQLKLTAYPNSGAGSTQPVAGASGGSGGGRSKKWCPSAQRRPAEPPPFT